MRLAFAVPAVLLFVQGHAALPTFAYFGALHGEIAVPGLPPLTWRLTADKPPSVAHPAEFLLTGDGLKIHATLRPDERGVTSWKIDTGTVDLARWAGPLAARFAPEAGAIAATGELIISGGGSLEDFSPVGTLSLRLPEATVNEATAGWTLEGFSVDGEFSLGPDLTIASKSPCEVRIRTISTSRFGARAFSSRVRLQDHATLAVDSAKVEIAGGEVEARPFTISLDPFAVQARVQVRRIGLQDFAQLIPSGLAGARGRLDGNLSLGWSDATGFQLGIGDLALDEFEPTVLRLAPAPGFLTAHMPARFEFLPGRLGRWLSIRNDAYDDLEDIELGHVDLIVNSLRVLLTPSGDAEGRSARVFIEASPDKKNSSVPKVAFTINVSGPLSRLLNLSMTDNISFDLK